ncbi:MAG TPA: hypothetical protein VLM79_30645 [Kofleriaceae bacterium]|nr:hypothetical protein [Kofleriaceae bacterium]
MTNASQRTWLRAVSSERFDSSITSTPRGPSSEVTGVTAASRAPVSITRGATDAGVPAGSVLSPRLYSSMPPSP